MASSLASLVALLCLLAPFVVVKAGGGDYTSDDYGDDSGYPIVDYDDLYYYYTDPCNSECVHLLQWDIAQLSGSFYDLNSTQSDLQQDVLTLKGNVTELSNEQQDLAEDVVALKNQVQGLTRRVEQLEAPSTGSPNDSW